MPNALEIIANVISQHGKITEVVKTSGDRMNDVDAVFTIQNATFQVAWQATALDKLMDKRDQLLQTVNMLGEGLAKHFSYEEQVLPLVFGELLMKDILDDHSSVLQQMEATKACLSGLEGISHEELLTKRLELIKTVDTLRDKVLIHARYEEMVLGMMKQFLEEKAGIRKKQDYTQAGRNGSLRRQGATL